MISRPIEGRKLRKVVGADEPSALARRKALDRLHRGRVSRRDFSRTRPKARLARRLAAVSAAIDHVLGERKRQISGQLIGRPVKRETRRAVWLDHDPLDAWRGPTRYG